MSADGTRPADEFHGERFAIIPEWLLAEKGDVVKLYGILDRYANRQGRLWPGQAELAERMECSERHVRTLLGRLRELGVLERVKRRYNATTIYRLRKERPEPSFLTDRNTGSALSGTTVPPNQSQEREPLEPLGPAAPKRTPKPLPKGKTLARAGPEADQLARQVWEAREAKPVCGFPALRSRIAEALIAGHTPEQVAAALPSMTTFSRDAFDFALGRARRGAARPGGLGDKLAAIQREESAP